MNLIAQNKETKNEFLVIKYEIKVKEGGSDTDTSFKELKLYCPEQRYQFIGKITDYNLLLK